MLWLYPVSRPTKSAKQASEQPTSIIRDEEANVGIVQDSCDTDEASTSTGDNGDILPSILARFSLAVHLIVQVGNRLPERLDASCRAIFAAVDADIDGLRARETSFDIILYLCACFL